MAVEHLPHGYESRVTGWGFAGSWTDEENARITPTLSTWVLNPAQVQEDPWLCIVHHQRSYAHCRHWQGVSADVGNYAAYTPTAGRAIWEDMDGMPFAENGGSDAFSVVILSQYAAARCNQRGVYTSVRAYDNHVFLWFDAVQCEGDSRCCGQTSSGSVPTSNAGIR